MGARVHKKFWCSIKSCCRNVESCCSIVESDWNSADGAGESSVEPTQKEDQGTCCQTNFQKNFVPSTSCRDFFLPGTDMKQVSWQQVIHYFTNRITLLMNTGKEMGKIVLVSDGTKGIRTRNRRHQVSTSMPNGAIKVHSLRVKQIH